MRLSDFRSLFANLRRAFPALLLLCLPGLLTVGVGAQTAGVTLTPAVVEAGSPVLIHVDAPAAAKVDGEWMGHTLEFFPGRDGHGWFALAGVDVEGAVGPSTLRIEVRPAGGAMRDLSRTG